MTRRKYLEYWTEVKKIVNGEVKQTCCCCAIPGATARHCALWAKHKTKYCRCDCHRGKCGPKVIA